MNAVPQIGRAIIGVLLVCLGLSGCSTLKFGYANLPEMSYWWLDRYVGFTDEQTPLVREALGDLQQWHRRAELPRVGELLAQMEALAPNALTPAQACAFADEGRARLRAVGRQAEPAVARIAQSFGPAQFARLGERHARNDRDFRREWLRPDPTERLERRVKQFEEHAVRLYGRLEAGQRALLRERLQTSVFDPERVLAERKRRQADAMETLKQVQAARADPAQARRLVREFLDRLHSPPDASWRQYQHTLLQENCATFAALHNVTTPAQRALAAERLRGWRRDVAELAEQAGRP